MELSAVWLTSVATTPGGSGPSEKLLMFPNGEPPYESSGNWPGCNPNALILIVMLEPADIGLATLRAAEEGLPDSAPKLKFKLELLLRVRLLAGTKPPEEMSTVSAAPVATVIEVGVVGKEPAPLMLRVPALTT